MKPREINEMKKNLEQLIGVVRPHIEDLFGSGQLDRDKMAFEILKLLIIHWSYDVKDIPDVACKLADDMIKKQKK